MSNKREEIFKIYEEIKSLATRQDHKFLLQCLEEEEIIEEERDTFLTINRLSDTLRNTIDGDAELGMSIYLEMYENTASTIWTYNLKSNYIYLSLIKASHCSENDEYLFKHIGFEFMVVIKMLLCSLDNQKTNKDLIKLNEKDINFISMIFENSLKYDIGEKSSTFTVAKRLSEHLASLCIVIEKIKLKKENIFYTKLFYQSLKGHFTARVKPRDRKKFKEVMLNRLEFNDIQPLYEKIEASLN